MLSREEKQEQRDKVRKSLIEAALQLSEEEGYESLSLRSVARKGGIAPTSFYRHFRDMDELGLALIDEANLALLEYMRQARGRVRGEGNSAQPTTTIVEAFEQFIQKEIETFMEYIGSHAALFRLFFNQRTGSSDLLRQAVAKKINFFVGEIATELTRLSEETGNPIEDIPLVAEAIITIIFNSGLETLNLSEAIRQEALEKSIKKSKMILLGASRMATSPLLKA